MTIIHTITEGGQIWAHRVRMLKQVIKIALSISLLLWVAIFAYYMYQLPTVLYQAAYYNLEANVLTSVAIDKMIVDSKKWEMIAREKLANPTVLNTDKVLRYTRPYLEKLMGLAKQYIERTSWITLGFFIAVIAFFFVRGRFSKKKKHISGKKVSAAWWINWQLIFKRQASVLKIGSLQLVKGSETQHILVTGGTGSGKTNCFHHILPQIRKQRKRAIIVDTTGILVERYFREGKDILLNPCDTRSAPWHPWVECKDLFDYESLAEGFIAQTHSEQDEYWRNAARSLLSSTLIKLKHSQKTSELTHWLLYEPLTKLAEFVQGTKAAAHIDLNSERTAASIRSVTSSFLNCLEFIKDTNTPFSIREWVEKDDEDSWLFLSCTPIQRAALNPFISCWFSIASRSLMQLEPSFKRKLWFVIDELPTLNKLKDLETLLSESRKYGGCALLSLQSPAQLSSIYGNNSAKTIVGNCATKIIFSEQNPEIAEQISKIFGVREIKEYQEGLSYGANEIRDGVNLSSQTKNLPLVSSTDIQFLEKNQAYVKLAGNIPVAKIKFKIVY